MAREGLDQVNTGGSNSGSRSSGTVSRSSYSEGGGGQNEWIRSLPLPFYDVDPGMMQTPPNDGRDMIQTFPNQMLVDPQARNNTGRGGITTARTRTDTRTINLTVSHFMGGRSIAVQQWQRLPTATRNAIVRAMNAKGWNLSKSGGKVHKVARPQARRERHRQHSRRRRH